MPRDWDEVTLRREWSKRTGRTYMLTTAQAATELGVSVRRIRALIASDRLNARKVGRDWLINSKDLEAVRVRTPGRPW